MCHRFQPSSVELRKTSYTHNQLIREYLVDYFLRRTRCCVAQKPAQVCRVSAPGILLATRYLLDQEKKKKLVELEKV